MATTFTPSPPPPHSDKSTNLPMLYYGLIVIGTAAVVLGIYNLIIIKWCTNWINRHPGQRSSSRFVEVARSQSFDNPNRNLLSSFKYRKDSLVAKDQGGDYECAVCLSVFEEGEDVRTLPNCKHSFHAPCIDMWLYSHHDCPLCRSPVGTPVSQRRLTNPLANSPVGLPGSDISV